MNKKTCIMLTALILSGCGQTDIKNSDVEETNIDQETDNETDSDDSTEYKYGEPDNVLTRYEEFEPQGEYDDSEPEYKDKTITFITGFYDGMISPVVTNAVNDYLEEQGYDFSVEFVGSEEEYITGFAEPHGDAYLRRKEAGLSADIYVPWLTGMDCEESYKYMVEQGYTLCLDSYLETETGQAILEGMLSYLDESYTMDDLYDLLDLYRASDGKLYCLPTEMYWTAPYMICYNNELKDYYNIPDFAGTIEDIYLVDQYAETLTDDKVVPFSISMSADVAFLNLGGYETYEDFWALKHEDDGSVTAVDFFEDENLLEWYNYLGSLCGKGYLYYSGYEEAIEDMDENLIIPAYEMDYEYVYANLLCEKEAIGYVTVNYADEETSYRTEYDILDVTTYSCVDLALCIDADTEYPEECLEFLALYYGDIEFRKLIYDGPEGWSYYVDDTEENSVIIYHTRNSGLPMFYGITSSSKISASILDDFQDRVDKQLLATKYMEPATIGWSNDLDFSSIQEKHDACVEIMNKYMYILWGVYGDDTAEKVEELHQMLIDAGYLDVIEYINETLAGGF